MSTKDFYKKVQSSFTLYSPKLETTQILSIAESSCGMFMNKNTTQQ